MIGTSCGHAGGGASELADCMDCGARQALSTPLSQPKAALRPVRVGGPIGADFSKQNYAKKYPGSWRAANRYERSVGCSAKRRPR